MRKGFLLGGSFLGLVVMAWLLSYIVPYDLVTDVDPSRAGVPPSFDHWLGTDHIGRDVFHRLLIATRAFVGPGFLACLISSVFGVLGGSVAGYVGGWTTASIRYLATVSASLPRFVLVLLTMAIFGNSTWLIGAVAGFSYAPTVAEAVFSRIDELKRSEFVIASRAHGISSTRILFFHLLWVNCRRMVGRHAFSLFGYLILMETALSYIGGFGVKEPEPSWGNMLAFEFGQRTGNPWGVLSPAIAIWLTILSTFLASEALAEQRHA